MTEETEALKDIILKLRAFQDELHDLRDRVEAVSGLEGSSYINKALGQLQAAEVRAMSKLGYILTKEYLHD